MSTELVEVTLIGGRKDSVDPHFAPQGGLAIAKNLRVRADGRLASRNGYVRQPMTTSSGTLVAYDLHEFQGRLCALGSDTGDAQPADIFEQASGGAAFPWRSSDVAKNQTLCPFTNAKEVAGTNQMGSGVNMLSSAAGGGFVCTVWQPAENQDLYAIIVRQSDGQVVVHQKLSTASGACQVCFAVDSFYVQECIAVTGDVVIVQCNPLTAATFTAFATHVAGGAVTQVHDIVPVGNPSTGRVVSAVGKATTTVKVFNAAGAQVGSTVTLAVAPSQVSVEGDQVDNTINLLTIASGAAGLRTFNFTTGAGTLSNLLITQGTFGSICRLPTLGANVQSVAVAIQDSATTPAGSDVVVQILNQSNLVVNATIRVQRAGLRSRLVNGQSGTQKRAVVFAAMLAPLFPTLNDSVSGSTQVTNALVYASVTAAHVSVRDLLNGVDPLRVFNVMPNLSVDSSTGRLCWICGRNGANAGSIQPATTIVDFLSAARRQSAQYGALLYMAGATVHNYDGTFPTELGFGEIPGIYSVTPAAAGGSLIPGGTYSYVLHWEYTRADGSLERSAPSTPTRADGTISSPATVTMGVGQNRNTIVCSVPHSVRVALGGTLFGGSLLAVLSRTVWDAASSTQGSIFRRCQVVQVPTGMAAFGAPLSIGDGSTDSGLATQGAIYTQGQHGELSGPVENDAPESCSFLSCSSARLLTAGLVRPFEFLESREAFLDETENFTQLSAFYGKVSKPIVGAVSSDGTRFLFSRDEIYSVDGVGPTDIGSGKLPPPVKVKSPSGLLDWRSLLECHTGIYFQLATQQLYQLTMTGYKMAPTWDGIDIQNTLKTFPTITGTALVRADDAAAFACCNGNPGTASRIVVRSLRTGIWTEDTPPLNGGVGISAVRSFGDYFAYISGGVVFAETAGSFQDDGATFPLQWQTYPLYPFKQGGYGQCCDVLMSGEYLSDGTLALNVSYDDGATFNAYDSFVMSGFTVGSTQQRRYAIQVQDVTSLVLQWTWTPSAAGEGFVIHKAAMLVKVESSKIKELNPAEMA